MRRRCGGLGRISYRRRFRRCTRRREAPEETDWHEIALLYNALLGMQPTAVVELNRAVAVAMAFGIEGGLRMLDRLANHPGLEGYHLLDSARADLLRRAQRFEEAGSAYRRALASCEHPVERRYLERRLAEVSAARREQATRSER